MCIGNQRPKNNMRGEKSNNSAGDIKQRAENPDALEPDDSVNGGATDCRADKKDKEDV